MLEGVTIELTTNANAWVFLPQWSLLFAKCLMRYTLFFGLLAVPS